MGLETLIRERETGAGEKTAVETTGNCFVY